MTTTTTTAVEICRGINNDSDDDSDNVTRTTVESQFLINYTVHATVLVGLALLVVIVVTAFGNLLVGIALFRYRTLRTISNYLIGNLAVSDFLLATTILPLSTVNECLGHWVFGRFMCNFWLITDVLYCTASIWNLCVIAFDRFTATLYPMWYRDKRSTKQAALYVIVVWLIAAAVSIPPLLGWNDLSQNYVYDESRDIHKCILFQTPSYVLFSAGGSFFVPFFITFALYVRIFGVLRLRMQRSRHNRSQRCRAATGGSISEQERTPLCNSRHPSTTPLTPSADTVGETIFDRDTVRHSSTDVAPQQRAARQPSCDDEIRTDLIVLSQRRTLSPLMEIQDSIDIQDDQMVNNDVSSNSTFCFKSIFSSPDRRSNSVDASICGSSYRRSSSSSSSPGKRQMTARYERRSSVVVNTLKQLGSIRTLRDSWRTSRQQSFDQMEMRATIRMAFIIAAFCGMWLGFFTVYIINGWCNHCQIPRELDAFFFWLGYLNSTVNPVLYTIFNDDFRRAFKKILNCNKNATTGRRLRRR